MNGDSTDNKSILDRVLSSQHAQAMEGFVPTEVFSALVKSLSQKEQEVLRRRYGLHGGEPETLEEIGKIYHVTRERIRQIENASIETLQKTKHYRDLVAPVERLITNILNTHGGAMEDHTFLQETLSHAGSGPDQERALLFMLRQLLSDRFEELAGDATLRPCWKLRAQSLEIIRHTIAEAVRIVEAKRSPMPREDLVAAFRATALYHDHENWFTTDAIHSYLNLAASLGRNPFSEYGLRTWGTIVPKRMNDKIYLILQKHGKPLHFTEIAKRINDAGFDQRQAYPPTVHNELILNKQYVLVGRGIYALREWGYKPGVVADVIVDVLRKRGRSLGRDELVKAVLEQRLVKRNTILLALTNRKRFARLANGEYDLVDRPTTTQP